MVAAYFQSAGRAKEALMITLGGILLVKLPVLLVGASLFSLTGIWLSEAVSEVILCVIAVYMLRNFQKKAIVQQALSWAGGAK
jgi:Na+-driven multidrug efflux pump